MDYLMVDTNIVSFVMKGDTRAGLYRRHLMGRTVVISFMTLAELYYGAIRGNWGRSKWQGLQTALRKYILLPLDQEMCLLWARIVVGAEQQGRPISDPDAWIAASALRYSTPLLTHNPAHFKGIAGLEIITELE